MILWVEWHSFEPSEEIVLCSWARHLTLTVLLFTKTPPPGGEEILLVSSKIADNCGHMSH